MSDTTEIAKTAALSDDGRHRYHLSRIWDVSLPIMLFIMLNPSTADADLNDNTVRKCMKFAHREGYGSIEVVNVFSFRTPHPKELKKIEDDRTLIDHQTSTYWLSAIQRTAHSGGIVVAGWGAFAENGVGQRQDSVAAIVTACEQNHLIPHCLFRTLGGSPGHPLYLPDDATLGPWVDRDTAQLIELQAGLLRRLVDGESPYDDMMGDLRAAGIAARASGVTRYSPNHSDRAVALADPKLWVRKLYYEIAELTDDDPRHEDISHARRMLDELDTFLISARLAPAP